jgi:hypothetical protein
MIVDHSFGNGPDQKLKFPKYIELLRNGGGKRQRERPMDMFETPAMPAQPIGGSFAWTVPQVMERDGWICRLGEADVAEIDEAVRLTRTRGLAIQEIGRDDFRSAA